LKKKKDENDDSRSEKEIEEVVSVSTTHLFHFNSLICLLLAAEEKHPDHQEKRPDQQKTFSWRVEDQIAEGEGRSSS
jgi:hypothetical protein